MCARVLGNKIIAHGPDSVMGRGHRRGSQQEQVQRGRGGRGRPQLPKGQIGLSVAVAGRPGDPLTPFLGCRLPRGPACWDRAGARAPAKKLAQALDRSGTVHSSAHVPKAPPRVGHECWALGEG